ncbi:hypothetical protein [Algicola sagamiensis]|uniref:hypothetical protein n=1 Tax=Algicola sagamiensis TaxID=163869 RepID=UPI00037DBDEA|nr:hypothetical protein [Algicola sagamiensis]
MKLFACSVVVTLFLVACSKDEAVRQLSGIRAPDHIVNEVTKHYRYLFRSYDWQLTEVFPGRAGAIDTYIQVPSLTMNEEQTINYVRQRICPQKIEKDLWQLLSPYQLEIHVYQRSKRHAITTHCVNPLTDPDYQVAEASQAKRLQHM